MLSRIGWMADADDDDSGDDVDGLTLCCERMLSSRIVNWDAADTRNVI